MYKILYLPVIFFLLQCYSPKIPADYIFINGKIYACDSLFHIYESVVIKNGKFLDVGQTEEMLKKYASDSVVNLKGKIMYPGFHDAHAHFFGLARSLKEINLIHTRSWNDVLDTLIKYSKESGKWILGRGWDQNDWTEKNFPTKDKLDSIFPGRPVFLKRIDGHAAIASSEALRRAGIHDKTIIPGGEIIQSNGKITGILIDNAMEPVENIIPPISEAEWEKLLLKAQNLCIQYGVTSITECGLNYSDAMLLYKLQNENKIHLNFAVMLSDNHPNHLKLLFSLPANERFRIIGIKAYADGALGSRGACLLQPYEDKKNHYGLLLCSYSHLDSLARFISKTSYQLCTHAIGDSAVRVVLSIYSKYLTPGNKKFWRVEHAQVVHPDDLEKFRIYGIIPSVQPTHAISDSPWATERLGLKRVCNAYAYRTLRCFTNYMPLGTDFPVEEVNPMGTFAAAVFRKNLSGYPTDGYMPHEHLDAITTLKGMTQDAAMASQMKYIGSISPGKKADFLISFVDLPEIGSQNISELKKWNPMVYINGKRIK